MSLLPNNIKFLRRKLGFTQETFANALGINRPSVGAYEEGRADPRLTTLSKMARIFNVSVDQLIHDDLTSKKQKRQYNINVLAVTVDNADEEHIQFVPIKAAAGYTNGYFDPEYLTNLPRFHLPILPKKGVYRAFEISGDSMLPIVSGSVIIGRYVEQLNDIKNGNPHVLVTHSEGVVYKRVFYFKEKGKLLLVSDNKAFSPYGLDPAEIVEVWEAKAYISTAFPDISSELSTEQLMDMMRT